MTYFPSLQLKIEVPSKTPTTPTVAAAGQPKGSTPASDLCPGLPQEFADFLLYTRSLE